MCALCACVCVTSIYKVEMLANCSVTMLVHAFVVKVNLLETSKAYKEFESVECMQWRVHVVCFIIS